jgi:Rps23 Pro-64 3,4-dihydroxylase Tpa1-like proline 4-hydroxylase
MKYKINDEKEFPHLIIDDFFTVEELKILWKEIFYLYDNGKFFKSSIDKKSGHNGTEPLALNRRCYPNLVLNDDQINSSLLFNSIVKVQDKNFHKEVEKTFKNSPYALYKTFLGLNRSNLVLNYYEESEQYKEHFDQFQFSMITWLFKEPKNFEGGDFIFTKNNTKIEIINNRCILFPGFYYHKVEPVKMINKNIEAGGRFSINRFFYTIYE